MTNLSIGIDTGGTYTDAVIVDTDAHKVIAAAKALTTHRNLAHGIQEALSDVFKDDHAVEQKDISKVCLSTTLATNALVEGQGSSVTVVLIGFDDPMVRRTQIATAIPDARIISIGGGHIYNGQEQAPLDEQALQEKLQGMAGEADAFAIASHYSVRNAAHEQRVAKYIESHIGKPVSLSCDLSDSLNGPKRALTAAFNARIISLIVKLQDAVAHALNELGIDAPILIVKGDGSVAASQSVLGKPIETILSGPAASVIGARYLTGLSDFVVADMGGTTSDVATVVRGWPGLNERGADIGGYRTLIKAIDMRTLGLGGDSAVDVDVQGIIELHAHRVVPIALLVDLWPHVLDHLKAAIGGDSGMRSALSYLVRSSDESAGRQAILSKREHEFLSRLDNHRPHRFNDVVMGASDRSAVRKLVERGLIRQSGFTPSDAAHVLGLQSQWNVEASLVACELLGRASGRVSGKEIDGQLKQLSADIVELVSKNSAHLIVEQLAGRNFSSDDPFVEAATNGGHAIGKLDVNLVSSVPLIAVGGPAKVFYPRVGELLGVKTKTPEYCHVANAVGAAVGLVRSERSIEITLKDNGGFTVHHDAEPLFSESAAAAIELASKLVSEAVIKDQLTKGGQESTVELHIDRLLIPNLEGDNALISATVTATCDSLPSF